MSSWTGSDAKAGFDHIYDQPDPREYFRVLRPLQYQIPALAEPVFQRLLQSRPGDVLDVCCSYGVNAALLRCELSLEELYARYTGDEVAGLSSAELAAADSDWYEQRLRPNARRVVGLDVAAAAVAYAERVRLLAAGRTEDLERDEPTPGLVRTISQVGLVTITGGIGYVTARTFDRLLSVLPVEPPPWVAAFCLRTYSYAAIARTLDRWGLVTEQLTGTFAQRLFVSADEQAAAVAAVGHRGLDPTGKEADGWYHCDFFLSRPPAEVAAQPAADLLGSGPSPRS